MRCSRHDGCRRADRQDRPDGLASHPAGDPGWYWRGRLAHGGELCELGANTLQCRVNQFFQFRPWADTLMDTQSREHSRKHSHKRLVMGNWKMHGNQAANAVLLDGLCAGVTAVPNCDVAVCV